MNVYKALQTKILAQGKLLRANEKGMKKAGLQMRCACTHHDGNGAISLNSPQGGPNAEKSKFTGAPLYMCRECYAKIDVSPISQEDFDKAIDTINRVLEIGKIKMDIRTDRDRELSEEVAEFQFKLHDMVPNIYSAIAKGGKKKKEKRSPYAGMVSISR